MFLEAVLGIFKLPYREMKANGCTGLIKGIYSGLVSIIIKPTVGIFDFLISIIDGIVN